MMVFEAENKIFKESNDTFQTCLTLMIFSNDEKGIFEESMNFLNVQRCFLYQHKFH